MHNDIPGAPRWYYEDNGERRGSLDEAQMIELIHAGRLDRHTPVWKIGSADWQLLDDSELRSHLDSLAPPPSSSRDIDNRLIWLLACAPLLGHLLEWVLAFALNTSQIQTERAMEAARYWYATLALNLLLGVLDERRLKQTGHDTARLRGWVWLAPAYLYRRARHLGHSLGYFVAWLLSFALLLLA